MGGSPDFPKQKLGVDLNKIFNAYQTQELPAFNAWRANNPELQQLQQFISGTEIPQLTDILNKFPDAHATTARLQTLLNNQPNINQTLGPLQKLMGQLPSAGQFAAPIGGVSTSLQNTFQNLTPVSQLTNPIAGASQSLQDTMGNLAPVSRLTDPLQARLAGLMNVAPTLRQGLATQAPIIANAGQTTRDQQQAAQQEALGTAALQGNVHGNQAALADILNQQKYKDARLAGAIQNVTGLEGIQGQDVSQRIALPQAIQQLTAGDVANRLGLTQGITGAQQAIGGLNAQDIANRLGLGQGITGAQQAQQGVYNQDLAARSGMAQLMDQLRSADVNRRMGLTSGIQNIFGTNLAQRLGLMGGITGAITQPLTAGEQTFTQLLNPLMGFAGNVFDANQNAQAAQSIAGANKNAGALSGALNAAGQVGGSYLSGLGG